MDCKNELMVMQLNIKLYKQVNIYTVKCPVLGNQCSPLLDDHE